MGFWDEASPTTRYVVIGGLVVAVLGFVLFLWPGFLLEGEPTTAERGVDLSRAVPAEQIMKKAQ